MIYLVISLIICLCLIGYQIFLIFNLKKNYEDKDTLTFINNLNKKIVYGSLINIIFLLICLTLYIIAANMLEVIGIYVFIGFILDIVLFYQLYLYLVKRYTSIKALDPTFSRKGFINIKTITYIITIVLTFMLVYLNIGLMIINK